jgi:hypothetical protein
MTTAQLIELIKHINGDGSIDVEVINVGPQTCGCLPCRMKKKELEFMENLGEDASVRHVKELGQKAIVAQNARAVCKNIETLARIPEVELRQIIIEANEHNFPEMEEAVRIILAAGQQARELVPRIKAAEDAWAKAQEAKEEPVKPMPAPETLFSEKPTA